MDMKRTFAALFLVVAVGGLVPAISFADSGTLVATPSSGAPQLIVKFTATPTAPSIARLQFGDSTLGTMTADASSGTSFAWHGYNSNGTFVATLYAAYNCVQPGCATLGTAT